MPHDDDKPTPEREQTDESLRSEREKTDRALATRLAATEDDADKVVEQARQEADAVLLTAREKADELMPNAAPGPAVVGERDAADDALRDERASADETLRREREEASRTLAELLPIDRDETDRYLLTERERSDDSLASRDDFLAIVSHDLRSLLGGIVLSAGLLAKRAEPGEAGAVTVREVDRIRRYAARMNRLVGDLQDVASIDAGKLSVALAPGELGALIDEAVDTFHAAAVLKGIALDAEPIARPLDAQFDHGRLLQVLANLVSNAIKFTPTGGSVRALATRDEAGFRVGVRDTGPGIPSAMLEAVFERFRQVEANDRRGLGLGLYISRNIVEAHGGKIWVESVLGQGSTLWFTLPAGASG